MCGEEGKKGGEGEEEEEKDRSRSDRNVACIRIIFVLVLGTRILDDPSRRSFKFQVSRRDQASRASVLART